MHDAAAGWLETIAIVQLVSSAAELSSSGTVCNSSDILSPFFLSLKWIWRGQLRLNRIIEVDHSNSL